MPDSVKFRVGFAPEVVDHLGVIARKYHHLIERAIDEKLTDAPEQRTRNRKPLEEPEPFGSTWELRCGPHNCFRIFYELDDDGRTVWVLAIGVKERERLLIAGEEFRP
jgi:mRNA-degrading endonuclease RelE of RelBE toxin-antitoxin system